jgi:hypothetical protein
MMEVSHGHIISGEGGTASVVIWGGF